MNRHHDNVYGISEPECAPLEHCWHCGGDGSLYYIGGPGHFSMHAEAYYPSEYAEPCPICQGTGMTDEPEPAKPVNDEGPISQRHYNPYGYELDELDPPF